MRLILTIAVACAFSLAGCVATTSARDGGRATATLLTPVDVDSFGTVETLAFSPDGRHFLAAASRRKARLYDTESRTVVWSFDRPDQPNVIHGAGFIHANSYFVGVEAEDRSGALIHIRTIEPSEEISTVKFAGGAASDPVLVNQNFVHHADELQDRRTGQQYRAQTAYPRRNQFVMTEDGRVLSTWFGGWMRLNKPLEGTWLDWHTGAQDVADFDATADGGHVLTISYSGRCTVWRLPEGEPVGKCGSAPWFGDGKRGRVRAHPHAGRFAVAWGDRVRVYDVAPFCLVFETRMDSAVRALAWSSNDRLAISTEAGTIEVWSIDDGRLIGTYAAPSGSEVLALSPEGDRLLARPRDTDKLLLFEIPRHP